MESKNIKIQKQSITLKSIYLFISNFPRLGAVEDELPSALRAILGLARR
jgi:hypothetical protein